MTTEPFWGASDLIATPLHVTDLLILSCIDDLSVDRAFHAAKSLLSPSFDHYHKTTRQEPFLGEMDIVVINPPVDKGRVSKIFLA